MKIVHICICSHVFCETYAYQDNLLPKYHKKLGHDVSIIAPVYSGFDKDTGRINCMDSGVTIMQNGIKLIRLKAALPCKVNQHVHQFHGLYKAIEQEKPDLIFAHSIASLNYRSIARYKSKHPSVRVCVDNHADYVNSGKKVLSDFWASFVMRYFVAKKLIDASEMFYGVTPARCDYLHEVLGVPMGKISLLPMGADDEEMRLDSREFLRKSVRQKYGISDDDFLIVTGGKIDWLKNIHVLAKAVNSVENNHLKLLIFGSIIDDMKSIFEQLKSDKVQCIGWVPSNEVYQYFYAADIVMFPGLHSVLWEQAVASKVPCAFSKIKGFEHVDFGGNCILMEGKDSGYYKHLLNQILSDKERYTQMLVAAQSDGADDFRYGRIAQKVVRDVCG